MRHRSTSASRRTLGAVAAVLVAVGTGCGGDDTSEPVADATVEATADVADRPGYGTVSADQAAALAASGVTVIDVRTPEEFAEGHVDGARLIDFYAPTFADDIASLDPDDEYLVYCRSGNRSGQAVALMQQHGIDRVWDLAGGVIAAEGSALTLVR